jgi:tetratricopeptide (TPR) repeat protein
MEPMKTLVTVFFTLPLLFGAASSAHAQCIEWKILNDEVKSLYQRGQYDRAVAVAKKALKIAQTTGGPDHPAVAMSLNSLAGLYYTQGRYAQAEPLYKRSLAIKEKALCRHHPDVATSLDNLVALYRKTNHVNEAQALEKRAAGIRAMKR